VRQPRRVRRHALLHRFSHLRCRAEEAVRRRQPTERLVRTLEVVAVDEEAQSLLAVCVVGEDRLAQPLVPQRLPEALHLPERLRVLRPTLHVTDAVASQLFFEVRLASPRRVLTSLVRQYLLRCPVRREPACERFHHQRRPLMVRQRPSHDVPRVVVHEGRQVQPLVTSQQKREDVRLPHLIRCSPLEAPRPVLVRPPLLPRLRHQPRLVQNPPHLRLTHAQRLEARQHIDDAPCAPLRVLRASRRHRFTLHRLRVARLPRRRLHRSRRQRVQPPAVVRVQPVLDRRHARPEHPRQLRQRRVSAQRLLDHLQSKRQRVCTSASRCSALSPELRSRPTSSFLPLRHPSLLSSPLFTRDRTTALWELRRAQPGITWRAAHHAKSRVHRSTSFNPRTIPRCASPGNGRCGDETSPARLP